MQAHHVSGGVVMDIAAYKVSHSVGADKDATAIGSTLVRVHVNVGQRCRTIDVESRTLPAK